MEDRETGIWCVVAGSIGIIPLAVYISLELVRNRYEFIDELSMFQIMILILIGAAFAIFIFGWSELFGYYTKKRPLTVPSQIKSLPDIESDLADSIERITQYAALLKDGAITQTEFNRVKEKILKER